ncbi:DUF4835 family protein [Flavobacteriaceae bacterium]|jgi:hypothetical protein|nr:DUF4835 family protein [Flavobacteriaceae bacterium]MBT7984022.1 DUF4835 family protein [Flavobacteriaceae bacterium]MDA9827652.1 DUF4835 family protein [Flavobacteriaceae bacterium]
MKNISLILITILSFNFSFSQEINGNIIINSESVNQTNNSVFINLENSISNFINNSVWSNENYSELEKINLNILFSIISYSNNNYVVNIEFQASRPVLNSSYSTPVFTFLEKNFQFEHIEFEPIIYKDNQFESKLSSLLAFYVNIIIGLDHNSYILNSGNNFYNVSKNILNYTNQNNIPGWNSSYNGGKLNKFWLIESLTSKDSTEFSDFVYNYHVNGLDLMYEDILSAKKNIASSISTLKPLKRRNPNSILVKIIFDSKSDEINDIFSGGSFFDVSSVVSDLNYLSPFFSNKWNSIR